MPWLLFIVSLTQPSITWKEGTSNKELSRVDWPVGRIVDHCFLVLIYVGVLSPLRMVPSIVSIRKLSIAREQVTRQPFSMVSVPSSQHESLPRLPSVMTVNGSVS